jgi:hypothetical protein
VTIGPGAEKGNLPTRWDR